MEQHEAAGQYLMAAHVDEAGQRPAAAGMRMHLNLKTRERARARRARVHSRVGLKQGRGLVSLLQEF